LNTHTLTGLFAKNPFILYGLSYSDTSQEEARRISFLKASQELVDLHDASTVICLLYRGIKARQIVSDKRLQMHLEKALRASAQFDRYHTHSYVAYI
jgi:hypothetical protein